MQLLGKGDRRIIVRKLACCSGAVCCESNPVVDVEDPGSAAWGPDDSSRLDFVVFGVDLPVHQIRAGDIASSAFLSTMLDFVNRDKTCKKGGAHCIFCRLREEIGRIETSRDAWVQPCIAVVGHIQDGILEPSRVLQAQVDLAVLGVVRWLGIGANVGLERVEPKGNYLRYCVSYTRHYAYCLGYLQSCPET